MPLLAVCLQKFLNTECKNMKLLFLLLDLPDLGLGGGGFYADLIKEMSNRGHDVFVICKSDEKKVAGRYKEGTVSAIRVNVPFLKRNTSLFKKGIGSLLMNPSYIKAYKNYLQKEDFDYVFIPTPPATLVNVAKRIVTKKKTKVYVILRDIQPECADRKPSQEVLSRADVYDECKKPFGIHPVARRLLYNKSQALYKIADIIGCMTPGNAAFVKKIAPYIDYSKLKVLPNWYSEPERIAVNEQSVREKYGLTGKFVAIFGGNIGPQQAVWNIAQLAKMNLDKKDAVFLVVGRGVAKRTLEDMAIKDNLTNMMFLEYMPRQDYEAILQTADLGMISIDEKYKVPTSPSKIIGYMALAKPVLAMFNKGNDYGEFYIDRPGCGLWSVDLDNQKMQENFEWFYTHPQERIAMGRAGYYYYKEHFTAKKVSDELCKQLKNV